MIEQNEGFRSEPGGSKEGLYRNPIAAMGDTWERKGRDKGETRERLAGYSQDSRRILAGFSRGSGRNLAGF